MSTRDVTNDASNPDKTTMIGGDKFMIIDTETAPNSLKEITKTNLAATATNPGVVELATDAETITGTDTARALTPANLQAMTADATRDGIVELATDAEAITGTDTVRAITPANLAAVLASLLPYNYLINGGFDFAQRQTPGTLTTIADNAYSVDRWRATRENADVQYIRVDATGESGLTSKYYGQFKKITSTGKFHVVQILEGINSVPLRGKTVIFQIKMKASSSKTIRMAVLELQNAGTMDAIPATLVTAFGANSTDPTLGANVAIITAAQSKSVTTAWQSFSVSVTVPSNSKNILCAFWTDSQFAANDTLSVAEAGLFFGSAVQPWVPRLVQAELALCQRYYEKSFSVDIGPAQAIGVGNGAIVVYLNNAATSNFSYCLLFKAVKRAVPTIASYNPAAANANWRDTTNSADRTVTQRSISDVNFTLTHEGAVGAANSQNQIHWSAESEL